MQKAEIVLSMLSKKSKEDKEFVFDRLYRNLFNPDFYIKAYGKIYAKEGNMTAGADNETIDGFNYNIIDEIIRKLKSETYYPAPVRRTYIPKKNGKLRPLGIPTFVDKLVQEAIRQILESIYEPIFLETSHGFRPNKSCHTALCQIKTRYKGTNWLIEGDIKGFFDNIDHEVLLKLIGTKINDGRLLELIRRFLKAGYFEFHQVKGSLSGTPQGGIISPILANIYLHELDKHMETLKEQYSTRQNARRDNPAYRKLEKARFEARQRGDGETAKEILKEMYKLRSLDPMDPNFIRVKYTRYADDFVVGIIGSKKLAEEIRDQIREFLRTKLNLELNVNKTVITNIAKDRARFLGFEISKTTNCTYTTKSILGVKRRTVNETIQLLVPNDVINKKLEPFRKNGKPVHYGKRVNFTTADIIDRYNSEIRGMYNYYRIATDVSSKIGKYKYYHYSSLAATIARKEDSSIKKVISKYGISVPKKYGTGTRNVIGVNYQTKTGARTMTYFNESIKYLNQPKKWLKDTNEIYYRQPQVIRRLEANKCELCGIENSNTKNFAVHHVRKLKKLKEKYANEVLRIPYWVQTMIDLNRKTLIVCRKCHHDIHFGIEI